MPASAAHDLRRVTETLELFHGEMEQIEQAARTHEQNDDARFRELQGEKGLAGIHRLLMHLDNRLTVIQDAQIEGFRRLNERMDGVERRARNGR